MRLLQRWKDRLQGKVPRGSKRSGSWPRVRAAHLAQHPLCAACGGTKKLEVHHRVPFHFHPELELDPANLITLCESSAHGLNCHLWIGHSGNFKGFNPDVVTDSNIAQVKIEANQARIGAGNV